MALHGQQLKIQIWILLLLLLIILTLLACNSNVKQASLVSPEAPLVCLLTLQASSMTLTKHLVLGMMGDPQILCQGCGTEGTGPRMPYFLLCVGNWVVTTILSHNCGHRQCLQGQLTCSQPAAIPTEHSGFLGATKGFLWWRDGAVSISHRSSLRTLH